MLAPRIASLSLVAYFDKPPDSLNALVHRLLEISAQLLGDQAIVLEMPSGQRRARLINDIDFCGEGFGAHVPVSVEEYEQYGIIDSAWVLNYEVWGGVCSERIGPALFLDLNLELLDANSKKRLLPWTVEFFGILGNYGIESGIGDVADFYEISRGRYYSGAGLSWVHPQRQFNRYLWAKAGPERIKKLRGIYWGSYLGPEMVAKLGSASRLKEGYLASGGVDLTKPRKAGTRSERQLTLIQEKIERDKALCHIYGNGAMLFLLDTQISRFCYPYDTGMFQLDVSKRYAWLYGRLRQADLLV